MNPASQVEIGLERSLTETVGNENEKSNDSHPDIPSGNRIKETGRNNFLSEALWMIIVFAVYFVVGKLGLRLAFESASATAVWAPTGIALAVFLIRGFRLWPAILIGAFLINLTTTGDIFTSICIAFGNTTEGMLGAFLVLRFAGGKYAFNNIQYIFKFILYAGIIATLISATIGVSSLAIRGLVNWDKYINVWITWQLGDAAGAFVVAPLLILWSRFKKPRWNKDKFLEGAFIVLVLAAICLLGFTPISKIGTEHYPLSYILIPPFVWIAFRFSKRFAAAAVFLVCGIAIWGTINGYGPFLTDSPNNSLLFLQAFICMLAMMTIGFASVINERNKINTALSDSEQKFHAIFRQASVGIAQFDLTGKFVLVNNHYCNIVGRTHNELLNLHIGDITHPEDNNYSSFLFNKLVEDGKDYIIEKRYVKPDSSIVWIKKSVSLIRDNQNKPQFVVAICSDVSDRKSAENYLNIQYSISKSLTESGSFKEASQKVIKSICEGIDWDLGAIWLVDPVTEVLRYQNSWYSKRMDVSESEMTNSSRVFLKGIGLPGRVWKLNEPAWLTDITKDDNFPRAKIAAQAGLHAGFAFPIRSGNEVIGIIECFSKKTMETRGELLELLDASGRQIGNFLDRKRAEEEREIAQLTYLLLFENSLDGILIVDDEGKYVNVNESYARMLKAKREDLIGKSFKRFIPPDLLNEAQGNFEELKTKDPSGTTEFPLMALDGSLVEAEWISRSNFLPGMHFCVARDITERKIAEKKLLGELSFRKALEDSIASGIAAVSADGTQTYVNPSLCRMLGWQAEELLGAKPPFVYWPEEEIQNISFAFARALNGNIPKEGFELKFCRKNGERFDVLVMISSITNTDNEVTARLASVTDITEMKKVQQDLREAKEELDERVRIRTRELYELVLERDKDIEERKLTAEKLKQVYDKLKETQNELIHSEKLASLGRFSAGIAHEIRNPLANISALAQLLSKKKLDPMVKKHLRYILVNSEIANKIIKDLLSFASPHKYDSEPGDIGKLVDNLCDIVKTRCEKNKIAINKKITPKLPSIPLNKEKLQAAFMNFISNAIEAMPKGGDLSITVSTNKVQNEIVIMFEDTGIGIKPENIDKILEPFFTTKNEGTGLGLSLAYQVVRAHAGKIEIDSKQTKGARFIVTLPVHSETHQRI